MKKQYKRFVVSERIKNEYGTLTHFARKKEININTLKAVLYGNQPSKKIYEILKAENLILSENEFGKEVK